MCAPDDGWSYHPKHVEQFPDINILRNVTSFGYILEYYYGSSGTIYRFPVSWIRCSVDDQHGLNYVALK